MGNKKTRDKPSSTISDSGPCNFEPMDVDLPHQSQSQNITSSPSDEPMDLEPSINLDCLTYEKVIERIVHHSLSGLARGRHFNRQAIILRQLSRAFWIGVDRYLRDQRESLFTFRLYESTGATKWVNEFSQRSLSVKSGQFHEMIRNRRDLLGEEPFPLHIRFEAEGQSCGDVLFLLMDTCRNDIVKLTIQEPSTDIKPRLDLPVIPAPFVEEICLLRPIDSGLVRMENYDHVLQNILDRCKRLSKLTMNGPPEIMRVRKLRYPPTLLRLDSIYCPPDTLGLNQGPLPHLQHLRLFGTTSVTPQADMLHVFRSCSDSLKIFQFSTYTRDPQKITQWTIRTMPKMTKLKTLWIEGARIRWSPNGIPENVSQIFPALETIKIWSHNGGIEAFADCFLKNGTTVTSVKSVDLKIFMENSRGNLPFISMTNLKDIFTRLEVLSITLKARFGPVIRTIFSKLQGLKELSFRILDEFEDGGSYAAAVEYEALILGTTNKNLTEMRLSPAALEEFRNLVNEQGRERNTTNSSVIIVSCIRQMRNLRKFALHGQVYARIMGRREEVGLITNALSFLSFELGFCTLPRLNSISLSGSFAVPVGIQQMWTNRGNSFSIHS